MNSTLEKLKNCVITATEKSSKKFMEIYENSPNFNLNSLDNEGNSLLSYIVTFYFLDNNQSHNYNLLDYILKENIEKNIPNNNGFPPIFLAVSGYNNSFVLEKLLLLPDINIYYKNNRQNLLHFACMSGNLENIRLLIEKDVFSLKDKDNNNETPFMIACSNFNLAKYFIMDLDYELSEEELLFLEKQKNVFNKPVEPIIEMYRKKQLSDKLNINLKENINKSIKPKI